MSGINNMSEWENQWKALHNEIKKLDALESIAVAMKDAWELTDVELSKRMQELAESDLLDDHYAAACASAAMRLREL